jgi:hypothetical protein
VTAGCSLRSHVVRFVAVTLLLVCAALPPRASAQAHRTVEIVVGDRVQVSADHPTFPHVEAHVAVSASPPTYMVGAAMVFEPGDYVPRLAAYTSHDSGRTWTRAELPRPEGDARTTGTGFFDPWTTITNEGIAYVSGLMLTSRGGEIYVWRSDDRGLRWKPPSRIPRGDGGSFDHPVTSVGPGGLVYVFANQGAAGGARGTSGTSLSRSTDGGATFGSPLTILPNNFSNINGNLATLSDGSLMTTWFEISKPGIPRIVHRHYGPPFQRTGDARSSPLASSSRGTRPAGRSSPSIALTAPAAIVYTRLGWESRIRAARRTIGPSSLGLTTGA